MSEVSAFPGFSWLADRAVPQQLTGHNDPFYQESGGNVLFKAYFN
jgi:hypothetical protein